MAIGTYKLTQPEELLLAANTPDVAGSYLEFDAKGQPQSSPLALYRITAELFDANGNRLQGPECPFVVAGNTAAELDAAIADKIALEVATRTAGAAKKPAIGLQVGQVVNV